VRNNDRIMKIAPSTLASPSKESNDQTEDCNNNSPSVDRLSHVSPDGIQHDGVQPTIGRPFRWPTPRRNSLQHLSSDQRHLTPRQEPRRAEFCRHQPNAVDERTIAIKVFLRTPHPTMPNFILSTEEIDSVTAYILSLARK
jgi:hypothetical protein